MKKVISLVFVLALCLFLYACSGEDSITEAIPETKSNEISTTPTEIETAILETISDGNEIIDVNTLLGTWQLNSMVIGDSTFSFDELVDLGMAKEEEKDKLIFIFQQGGKVYNNVSGNIIDWSISDGIVTMGSAKCQYYNGLLRIPTDEYTFNMEKVSENQDIDIYIQNDIPDNDHSSDELIDGLRPEFKEAMDAYEAFYDEYCDFMEEYMKNPTDFQLLLKYSELLAKAEEMDRTFEEWDDTELNDAELKYYLEVSNRIMQRLLEAAQ